MNFAYLAFLSPHKKKNKQSANFPQKQEKLFTFFKKFQTQNQNMCENHVLFFVYKSL
jgi:hypothetical protein